MHVRSQLLSTVLCGSVLLFALAAAGQANAAETIRPQGSWAVSKVEAKQPGTVPYCALSRRFGNGTVLTFARNASDESSLAVDLPSGTLQPGKTTKIDFEAGEGVTRSFDAMPASERSVIVRFGKDYAFYEALEKSGQLTVSLSDKAFTFAMPDVKTGVDDLSACLGQAVEPAAGEARPEAKAEEPEAKAAPEAPVEPAPAPKAAKKADAKKPVAEKAPVIAAMEGGDTVQALKEENIRLRNALERERREFENRFQKVGDNTSASAELSEKLRLLEIENGKLRAQQAGREEKAENKDDKAGKIVASTDDMPPVMAVPAACVPEKGTAEEITTLQNENTRLKAELDAQKQRLATAEKTGSDAKPAQDGKINAAMEAQIASLQERLKAAEYENESLKASRNAKPQTIDITQQEKALATVKALKEAEAKLSDTMRERDTLKAQIETLSQADADGRMKISSENWNLEQATQRFNEAEREIRRLGSAVEAERAKCAVEKKNLEYMLFDPKVANQEQISRLTTLEEELAKAKQALNGAGSPSDAAKIKDLEAKLDDLSRRNASFEQQVSELKQAAGANAKTADSGATEKIAFKEQKEMVEALQQEIGSLNAQVANLQSEKAAMATQLAQINTAAGAPASADVRAARSIARADTVVSRPDIEIAPLAAPKVAAGNARPVTAQVVETAPVTSMTSVTAGVKLASAGEIEGLLRQADVTTTGAVQQLDSATGAGRVAYRWETNGMFGTAEQKGLESTAQFDTFVRDYLGKTKSRCGGQFASVPATEDVQGSKRISAYEIACVDENGAGASAAMLFYTLDGKTFTTIAHETAPESMDVAMDIRDKILGVLQGEKTAAR
ncbi:MAG: hypothetical protein HYU57_00330 [Micavibrio aeruginosavorus]|nr:hypothetical protein [Micavibrio aeruginosavorus]